MRFEPEFIGVGKEQQAEKQEDNDKSEGEMSSKHNHAVNALLNDCDSRSLLYC